MRRIALRYLIVALVAHSSVRNQDSGVKKIAVAGFPMPSQMIAHRRQRTRFGVGECDSKALAQSRFDRLDAEAANRVFPSRRAPVAPLAMLALYRRDRAHRLEHLLALHDAEVKRQQRHRVGLIVRRAHPAAAVEIVAGDLAPFDAREEADVLRQQIDAVVVRMRKADFELARQVLRAVDRLLGVQRCHLLPVLIGEKHLVVGRTPRRHLARHRMRKFVRIERQLGVEIVDRTRDRVAIDVAARAERRELVTVVADAHVDLANQRDSDCARARNGTGRPGARSAGGCRRRIDLPPRRARATAPASARRAGILTRTMKMKSPSFLPLSLRSRCL